MTLTRLLRPVSLVLLSVLCTNAQETQSSTQKLTGKLNGTVVNADGAAVTNAQVIVNGVGFKLVVAATTEGTFESELPVGTYLVVAVKEPVQVSSDLIVSIRAGTTTNIKLVLKGTLAGSIRDSHIKANVPAESDFDTFLKRDLKEFFHDVPGIVEVEYELLRREPTQSGVAFPKFYAWVVVKSDGKLVEEGAVRIAAIEKKEFEVVNYLTRADVERDGQRLAQLFPADVVDRIKEKLKK